MFRRMTLFILLMAALLAGCSGAASSEETGEAPGEVVKIRLPMGYIPDIQQAPFYVAVEKGYFAERGIEIEFDYSFETDGVALVGAEALSFSVASAEQVLLAREQGIPVVYVMAWYQDFPTAVVVKSESEIETPADLRGKRVGVPMLAGASYVGLRALLMSTGVEEADLTLDVIGFNQVEALAVDQEEAVVGYITNEPIQLAAQGYDVRVMAVADYVQLASNGLITNEATIANNPALVRGMVAAIVAGIEDTLADPEEAYEISKLFVESLAGVDEAVPKEVLARSIEFWEAEEIGVSSREAWENMQEVLLDMALLNEPLNLDEAYTNEFIP